MNDYSIPIWCIVSISVLGGAVVASMIIKSQVFIRLRRGIKRRWLRMKAPRSKIPDIREMEKSEINALSPEDFQKAMTKQHWDRALDELVAHDYRSFLERYALYMVRAQMLEIYLKQDLENIFGVPEEKLERMTLGAIRYWFENNPQVSIHPSFDVSLSTVINQRNSMAHDFLFTGAAYGSIAGKKGLRLHARDLGKWSLELELTFQGYLMLKEMDLLYLDLQSASTD